jgi:hypothetical protein
VRAFKGVRALGRGGESRKEFNGKRKREANGGMDRVTKIG